MNKHAGGPAFPFPAHAYQNGEINPGEGGMSLRDFFAAAALQGYLAGFVDKERVWVHPDIQNTVAGFLYCMADAMLKARAEGGTK